MQKSDIKVLNGVQIRAANGGASTVSTSSLRSSSAVASVIVRPSETKYPVEQNPFGDDNDEEDEFSDEDNPKPSQNNNITSTSSINPCVPLTNGATSSPLSVKAQNNNALTSARPTVTENEYENLNKIPTLLLYDNINPDLNLKHLATNYDNPIVTPTFNDIIYQNLNQENFYLKWVLKL